MRIGTRTRKIVRDVMSRKVRTLLVSLSIFVGVFGVVTLVSAGELLIEQLEKDIQPEHLPMLRNFVSAPADAELDNTGYLQMLRDIPEVTHAEGRAIYPLSWRLPNEREFSDGVIVSHTEPFAQSYLEPPRLTDGEWPTGALDGDTRQIAIERRMADQYDLGIGDSIDLRVLSVSSNGDASMTVTGQIVGIFFQPYGYPFGPDFADPEALMLAAYDDAQYIGGFAGLNMISVQYRTFDIADAEAANLQSTIANNTPYVPVFSNLEDPDKNPILESTRSTNSILATLGIIALIVSGFLVVNVIMSIVGEQRRQIGVMKSLGASKFDKFYIYSGMAFMYGLIGVIPGVLLGIPAGYVAAQGLAAQSNAIIEDFDFSPTAIVLGAVVGLAVPVLASILPVFLGTRVSIREATTDMGINAQFGKGRLERSLGNLPVPITLHQSINNAFKKKYRLLLTGITLTVASGAFMGIFSVFFALTGVVQDIFDSFGNQISISPNEGRDFDEMRNLIASNVDGLQAIEPGVSLAIEIEGYDPPPSSGGPPGLFAVGFNTENPDISHLEYTDGTGWQDDPLRDGVVISSSIAEATGIGNGDQITIRGGGNRQTFRVIGVTNYPFDSVWFRWRELAVFGGLVQDPDNKPYANSIDVVMSQNDPSSDAVDAKIDEINEVLLQHGITSSNTNWVAFAEMITQLITVFGVILSLAALLIAAVGGIGLLSTLSMSVFERQREIGIMRSVGATSRTVASQFLFEGLIVGIISWLIAVPLSLGIRAALLAALPFPELEIAYPPLTLVVGLVGMMVLTAIASFWPSIGASRKTVSDILRYQ